MGPDDLRTLRQLLRGQRLLTLAVVVDGQPVAGVLPFVAAPNLRALVVHASGLARHTRGLGDDRTWSAAVAEPDDPASDPLQTRRVVLEGRSRRIGDPAVLAAISKAWAERFPSAAMTLALPDFAFFSLDVDSGRLIVAFGRALNLSTDHLAQAAALD